MSKEIINTKAFILQVFSIVTLYCLIMLVFTLNCQASYTNICSVRSTLPSKLYKHLFTWVVMKTYMMTRNYENSLWNTLREIIFLMALNSLYSYIVDILIIASPPSHKGLITYIHMFHSVPEFSSTCHTYSYHESL